jgi:pilus assembly protein Flp/PilA
MVYLPNEEGQGLAEYGLIIVLIAIVVVAILGLLGEQFMEVYSQIVSGVTGAGGG